VLKGFAQCKKEERKKKRNKLVDCLSSVFIISTSVSHCLKVADCMCVYASVCMYVCVCVCVNVCRFLVAEFM